MQALEKFFSQLKLPNMKVPNGSIIWESPQSEAPMKIYIHRKFYSLDEHKIEELENQISKIYKTELKFINWYRNFLRYANGVDLFFGAISLYGYQIINRTDPLHESPYSLYIENLGRHKKVPKSWLFIGSYGYDGTEIVIDTAKEDSKIFCIYNETDQIICEWDNFEQFLEQELQRLSNQFKIQAWSFFKKGPLTLPKGHKSNI